MLGVAPAIGRDFLEEEDQPGHNQLDDPQLRTLAAEIRRRRVDRRTLDFHRRHADDRRRRDAGVVRQRRDRQTPRSGACSATRHATVRLPHLSSSAHARAHQAGREHGRRHGGDRRHPRRHRGVSRPVRERRRAGRARRTRSRAITDRRCWRSPARWSSCCSSPSPTSRTSSSRAPCDATKSSRFARRSARAVAASANCSPKACARAARRCRGLLVARVSLPLLVDAFAAGLPRLAAIRLDVGGVRRRRGDRLLLLALALALAGRADARRPRDRCGRDGGLRAAGIMWRVRRSSSSKSRSRRCSW